ncbi:proline racemase family protein [Paracoccus sp. pheM1]|nr:proline racemase family protein [Paracoccus sp. pheM1]
MGQPACSRAKAPETQRGRISSPVSGARVMSLHAGSTQRASAISAPGTISTPSGRCSGNRSASTCRPGSFAARARTGTCAKGELPLSQSFRHQNILGNVHAGRLVWETKMARRRVVLEISGAGWIHGLNLLAPDRGP